METYLPPEAYNFIKKETLAQVFSCEFCEISSFSYRAPPVAASDHWKYINLPVKTIFLSSGNTSPTCGNIILTVKLFFLVVETYFPQVETRFYIFIFLPVKAFLLVVGT